MTESPQTNTDITDSSFLLLENPYKERTTYVPVIKHEQCFVFFWGDLVQPLQCLLMLHHMFTQD